MASEQKPRIPPLLPPQWEGDILDALNAFPSGVKFVQTGWEETGEAPRGTHMLGSFAHHPALANAFLTFNNHVAINSTLSARERELLILRTGWLRQCKYEYVMHVIIGLRVGLTEDDIERTQHGPDVDGWLPEDALLVRACDELHASAQISDATWAGLSERYNHQQIMDIIFLVGCYEIIAMLVLSLRTPLETAKLPLEEPFKTRILGAFSA